MSKDVLRRSKSVCLTKSWKENGLEELEEGAPDLFAELSLVDINVALGSNHQNEKGSWRWSSNDDSVKLHDFARNYFSFFKDNL